ncbi:glycosyltransferase family 4 protein [Herbaspirillum sp. RU 5E]|uniref:glycosyltransferase family 4 protein n=1 Tax=Herbaspirillum sp. CAH-3 TaxID=2605746 RepID=UPI0012ACDB0D|nr:glycosyltransferase family 4 protein [Herbaspirillum sp. CAH-3]MBW9333444.1 glycosyltransferase family 4 protein [Herbaspirillum sp. RU 5E]MRT28557.1 glycosyltransferase family 4 protein [Herbaspirillum sp. CAH-3]
MKILIVTQHFWPENFRINDLAEHFSTAGHEVTVLTGQPNYPEGSLFPEYAAAPDRFSQYHGVQIVRIPHVLRGRSRLRLVVNYFSYFVSGSILGAWKLRAQRFDAIFVFAVSPITVAIPAVVLGKLKKTPVFVWVQDLWPETLSAIGVVRSPRILGAVGRLVSWIYNRCDHILIQSRSFADSVRRYCADADKPGKLIYFPNWAEEVFGQQVQAQQNAVQRREDLFTVMFAGNIGEAQDFPAVLDAAQELSSDQRIRWVIVGDGRAREWVTAEVERRGLQSCVELVGRFPVETMPAFFECADAMLVALKDDEAFARTVPGKVQSYLAAAKPILGMINGEAGQVVNESGGGLACAAGASADLAANVRALAAMPREQLVQMGLQGRQYYQDNFERKTLFAKLEQYFSQAARS